LFFTVFPKSTFSAACLALVAASRAIPTYSLQTFLAPEVRLSIELRE
jgi:hypothetical protein